MVSKCIMYIYLVLKEMKKWKMCCMPNWLQQKRKYNNIAANIQVLLWFFMRHVICVNIYTDI